MLEVTSFATQVFDLGRELAMNEGMHQASDVVFTSCAVDLLDFGDRIVRAHRLGIPLVEVQLAKDVSEPRAYPSHFGEYTVVKVTSTSGVISDYSLTGLSGIEFKGVGINLPDMIAPIDGSAMTQIGANTETLNVYGQSSGDLRYSGSMLYEGDPWFTERFDEYINAARLLLPQAIDAENKLLTTKSE